MTEPQTGDVRPLELLFGLGVFVFLVCAGIALILWALSSWCWLIGHRFVHVGQSITGDRVFICMRCLKRAAA